MKTKNRRKLIVGKETLKALSEENLKRIAGGLTGHLFCITIRRCD